ncbi:MAG: response regulator [Candidatus Bathyarchaeia archaeon]
MSGNIKVLVVDAIEDTRNLTEIILRERGYVVYTAGSRGEALRVLDEQSLDLILMDVMLPDMNGFEACRELKIKPATREIPVVMFTVLDRDRDREMAAEVEADGYLAKPFEADELVETIEKHLK